MCGPPLFCKRKVAYLCCLIYWIVLLWREAPPCQGITPQTRDQLFTPLEKLEYDLQKLRRSVLILFCVLVATGVYYYRRSYRSGESAWKALLGRLADVDRQKVAAILLISSMKPEDEGRVFALYEQGNLTTLNDLQRAL
jgi:hypothetical protein